MDIVPKTIIQQTIEKKARQRPIFMSGNRRTSNKKNTRGRYTQYIVMYDDSIFPPRRSVKCIKHPNRF